MMTPESVPIRESQEVKDGPARPDYGMSFLVADIGQLHTAVSLFDMVDGSYRLVASATAQSSAGPPWYDAKFGFFAAIEQITEATGRPLIHQNGQLLKPQRANGEGIDYFGLVASVAEPLRVLTIGLLANVSLASGRKALSSIYAQEVDSFNLTDGRNRSHQLHAFLDNTFDLVMIVGGTEGGAKQRLLQEVATLAIGLDLLREEERPTVLYAGNVALRSEIDEMLSDLTPVYYAGNVRPDFEEESLDLAIAALGDIYVKEKVLAVPGMEDLVAWSSFDVMPTGHALAAMAEYHAAVHGRRAVLLDVGSSGTVIADARPGHIDLRVDVETGYGPMLVSITEQASLGEMVADNPVTVDPAELRDAIFNQAVRPQSLPLSGDAIEADHIILKHLIKQAAAAGGRDWGWSADKRSSLGSMLLSGYKLGRIPESGRMLLSVLDGLLPEGVFQVERDRYGVLPALGLIASEMPQLVVEALAGGILEHLGWVVVVSGRPKPGEVALKVITETPDGEQLETEVNGGLIQVVQLESAELPVTLKPASSCEVGSGLGKTRKITPAGGGLNLIVDARGRPLPLAEDALERQGQYQRWLLGLSG